MSQWRSHQVAHLLLLAAVALPLLLTVVAKPAFALSYAFRHSPYICFVEEISQEDFIISGRYNWFEHPDKSLTVHLVLYDPEQQFVSSADMKRGEHAFRMSLGRRSLGPYRLCAEVTSPNFDPAADPPLLIEFDVDQTKATAGSVDGVAARKPEVQREIVDGLAVFTFTDEGGQSKNVLQPRAVLASLENALTDLQAGIADVMAGLSVGADREDRMRVTSESTFIRVWVCALVTMGVTAICVWVQFRVLRLTIVKKKLI